MYISKANEALLLDPTPLLDQLFPAAVRLPDNRVVLPHTLSTFRTLQTHGYMVPHPMFTYYNWGGGTPFETQKLTAHMLVNNRRAYVLNAMGTGKTRAALYAWDYLYGTRNAKKLLVVCPLSVMKFGWGAEIFRILPNRKVVFLHGTKAKRLEQLNNQDADIYVINHDGTKVIATELMQMQGIDTLIIDELAILRNGKSARNKLMRKIAAGMKWAWGLTGGPMPNAPTDVWGQCKILTPNTIPKFFTHFQDQVMKKVDQFRWVPRQGAVETAFQVMQPAVRFTLDEVTELPPVIERFIDVPLSEEQSELYTKLKVMFMVWVQEKKITAVNAAAAMTKLLQVSAGWVYAEGQTVMLDGSPRLEMLLDLIDECERKVIVFGSYKHVVDGLSEALTENKIEHIKIHGDVPQGQRPPLFNAFQNTERFKVLLAQPACMAHGLTLTAADTVIWYCPITSYETYDQADGRIRRVGQEHKQQIIHLQATPVERRVYSLLKAKENVQNKFLQMFLENGDRT